MINVTIPGEAPSTPNLREHWATKAKRTKAQRAAVARRMPKWTAGPLLIVRLTRVAPRSLDTDNLAAALKGHRDAVAACLRVDDASPLVRWEYHQSKGEPAVVVNAWRVGEQAPEHLRDAALQSKGDAAKARSSGKARLRAEADAIAERSEKRLVEKGYIGQAVINYTPPRSTPVDAAKEAEVFAPSFETLTSGCHVPTCAHAYPCPKHQLPNMGKR